LSIPTTVKASFWLLLIGIILDFVAAAIQLFTGGIYLGAKGAGDGVGVGFIIAGVLTLAFAIVQLIVIRKMRAGRNWARVLVTILEVLAIIGVVLNPAVLPIAASVVGLVAIVLMWLPASNAYFRNR